MNRLAPQQHIYAYQQPIRTPPLQNTSACVFPQDIYGTPLCFDAPAAGIVSPHGADDYYSYGVPQPKHLLVVRTLWLDWKKPAGKELTSAVVMILLKLLQRHQKHQVPLKC